jgi:hypothetical protein
MRSIANKQILIMELFNTTQHLLLLEVIVSRTLYSYQTSGQYMLFQQGDRLNGGRKIGLTTSRKWARMVLLPAVCDDMALQVAVRHEFPAAPRAGMPLGLG